MKRRWLWIICIVMGVSFLVLLYLQVQYARAMVKMRHDQFNETVFRCLDHASRELEREETFNYLQQTIHERNQQELGIYPTQKDSLQLCTEAVVDSALIATGSIPHVTNHLPPFSLNKPQSNIKDHWSHATTQFRQSVQHAYVYEQELLNEVIIRVLYSASEKQLHERLNVDLLTKTLHNSFERSGITLPFHFIVFTSDGREVFRSPNYSLEGSSQTYTQTLFRNDPTGKMGYIQLHFPDLLAYLLGVISVVTPAMVFTLVLCFTFFLTVYLVVRQRKITQMKNDFVNNMTHEFKTPLSTISIAAQMLADQSIEKNAATFERLGNIIYGETRRLRFQVEKVLQMSLFDRNNIALRKKELDTNEVIKNIVETISLKVTQEGGEVITQLKAENPVIYADEMHFTNIIFNLIDNAVKYKRENVPLHLEVATWNIHQNLCISIKDNGLGISKNDLKHIFERFHRVHTGNTHNVKGFGLGLTYVRKMIMLHKGTVKVESELGVGSRFVITLPINKQ